MNQQPINQDTMSENQRNKNRAKIIVIAASCLVAILITVIFLVLYFGGEGKETYSEGTDSADNTSFTDNDLLSDESAALNVSSGDDNSLGDSSQGNNGTEASNDINSIEESSENDNSGESSEDASIEEPDHQMVVNSYGYTYLYYGAGYNQFNGTQKQANKYADTVNSFASKVDFPVYSIIAPTAVEFVDIPRDIRAEDNFYNKSQREFISYVANALTATPIDAYSLIAEKANEEYLYLRTDKNWTADAAYLAYSAFCTSTGNIAAPKSMYEAGSYIGYLGNFYQATLSEKLKANADTVNFYKISDVYPCNVTRYTGGLATKNQALIYSQLSSPTTLAYYVFLGDRGETFTITSQDSATEKTILVVGDSSAFAFVPYLVANYRTVYFVNTEAYKGSLDDYLSEKNIDHAVFLSYATSAATNSYVTSLNKIINSQEVIGE